MSRYCSPPRDRHLSYQEPGAATDARRLCLHVDCDHPDVSTVAFSPNGVVPGCFLITVPKRDSDIAKRERETEGERESDRDV